MNWEYRSVARKTNFTVDIRGGDDLGTFPIERARLRATYIYSPIMAAACIGYGWALKQHTVSRKNLITSTCTNSLC